MRIAALRSSGAEGAREIFPAWRKQVQAWTHVLATADWVPWAIIGLAAFLRVFLLEIKPAHFDEGINGWFVDQMVKNGFYKYDPTNYHGPLHFYVLFLSQALFGRNIWALRMPVVLVSVACVYLAMRFEPLVGRGISRLAALAIAVSPGFIFYGRYSIHEVWLQLFSMLFILGLLGMWRFGTKNYLWFSGIALAGMVLTKETYIIHVGCALLALPTAMLSNKLSSSPDARPAKQLWDHFDLLVVMAVSIAAVVFFYSGTFFHWNGVKGLYQCFQAWFATGNEGHGHEKAWWYWLMLIGRYEWPVALGLLGCALCQFFKNISLRYIAIYGVGTLAAYSIVNYKTPWCIVSFVWPFAFIFATAIAWVSLRQHLVSFAASTLLLCGSLGASIHLNYFRCTTDTEPYVYVQTYNDIFKLTRPLLKLADKKPTSYHLVGHMIRTSAYPLPWILGDFSRVGYYDEKDLPAKLDADFLVVQEDRVAEIEPKLQDAYYTFTMKIRAFQDDSKVYFKAKLFKNFFPGKDPDFPGIKPPAPTPVE